MSSSEEGASGKSLEEVFKELGLTRKDPKSNFAFPDRGLASLIKALRPSIHLNEHCKEVDDTEDRERNSVGCQNVGCQNVGCRISQGSFDSSTLTIKSDMLGDLKRQILKPDTSVSSLQLYDGLVKQGDFRQKRVSAATNTLGCCRRSHRSSRSGAHTKTFNKRKNEKKRNESEPDVKILNKENLINNKTGMIDKELLDVHLYQTCTARQVLPLVPAEKESYSTVSSSEETYSHNTNKYYCQREPTKDEAYQNQLTPTVSTDNQISDFECQSIKRDSIQTVNSKVRGDIISNVDRCFRSPISSRTNSRSSNVRQTLSDSAISNSKNTKGLRKCTYFRNADASTQKNMKSGNSPTVYWAITKINVYPDNSRTYEVMPLTGKRPSELPDKSDSVFVLIPPKKIVPNTKVSQK